jgi:hypothetical protein
VLRSPPWPCGPAPSLSQTIAALDTPWRSAESLYEAAALGLEQLRRCDWLDVIGPAARLDVEVKAVPVRHEISVAHVRRWCESSAVNPDERMRKDRVKSLLG